MEQFKNYLQSKDLSPITIKEYIRQIGLFTAWYEEEPINSQKKDVLNYLSHLKNKKNLQTISRNNALIALRHYFDYLIDENLVCSNPTALIRLRGMKKRKLNHTYTPEELTELADTYYLLNVKQAEENLTLKAKRNIVQNSYLAQMRNYVILLFFVHQGLRTNEILSLQTDDIILHKATVHIQGGKRGKSRTLPLHAAQIGSLMLYMQNIRPQLANAESGLLFLPVNQGDKAVAPTAATALVKLSAKLKRMDNHFNDFAQLRSSVITWWIQSNGLRKAQYMAGHKSIVSTEEYLPNYIEDLADDMTKFNPF